MRAEDIPRSGPWLQMFGIFDVKVGTYGPIYFARSKQEGARLFWDMAADPQTAVNRHPEDYRLFHLGEIDVSIGKFVPAENGPALWEEGAAVKAELQRKEAN